MLSDDSVTRLIEELKDGQRDVVCKLWEGYFHKLVCRTRCWLRSRRTQGVDAEDIALSAFDSFCRRAEQGRFIKLFDRNDLWKLLTVIAFREMCNQIKFIVRRQPLNRKEINFSDLPSNGENDVGSILIDVISREPDPALVVEMNDRCWRLLEMLPTAELRDIAVWKLADFTNKEIAGMMNGGKGRTVSTVERK